jgi:hypothetical protein
MYGFLKFKNEECFQDLGLTFGSIGNIFAVGYLNPTTNKSKLAFLALVCDETKPKIEFALKAFKKIYLKDELIFTFDKIFGQLNICASRSFS